MAEDGAPQKYLDLSQEYAESAAVAFANGHLPPAKFLAVHALELGVKAAIAARTGDVPRTHNVGGEFGRLFRAEVGGELTRRVNRVLGQYDGPRYPDWEAPDEGELAEEIAFVQEFVRGVATQIVEGARG